MLPLYRTTFFVGILLIAACTNPKSQEVKQPKPPTPKTEKKAESTIHIPNEKYHLKNGLTVILHQDRRLPLVATSIWYDVGALHEVKGRSGFAHLFEHMMFQGSPNVGEDQHFKILEEIGGSLINGTTSFDRTNYFETVPSHELETVLWMESDRMGFLLESVTQAALQNQIDVVKNERRQSIESRPYGLMAEKLIQTLYPSSHPYYGNIIGSMEDIGAATLADVQNFFKTYYSPANATLVLAGDFEVEKTKKLIEKYFGSLKGQPKPKRPKPELPPIKETQIINFEEPVGNLAKLSIAWQGPTAYEKDCAALDLLMTILSGSKSSRLDKRLQFDDNIAQSVSAHFSELWAAGIINFSVIVRPEHNIDNVLKILDEVLHDMLKNPATKQELQRAKNQYETMFLFGLEYLGGFSGRTEALQRYQYHFDDPNKIAWDLNRYQSVTIDDVQRVLKTWLLDKPRIIVKGIPKATQPTEK